MYEKIFLCLGIFARFWFLTSQVSAAAGNIPQRNDVSEEPYQEPAAYVYFEPGHSDVAISGIRLFSTRSKRSNGTRGVIIQVRAQAPSTDQCECQFSMDGSNLTGARILGTTSTTDRIQRGERLA